MAKDHDEAEARAAREAFTEAVAERAAAILTEAPTRTRSGAVKEAARQLTSWRVEMVIYIGGETAAKEYAAEQDKFSGTDARALPPLFDPSLMES